jgi:hypothetical protein
MSGSTTRHQITYPTSVDNVAPLAGHFKTLADTVDTAIPQVYQEDMTGSPLTLTTSEQDLANCTVTFTTGGTLAIVEVTGVFDFEATTVSGTTTQVGQCNIDGATEGKQALFRATSNNGRVTASQTWLAQLLTPGSHTVKLRAKATGSGGSYKVNNTHTCITVKIYDIGA